MSIFNFIKGILGFPDNQDHHWNRERVGENEPPNKFRKPIWSWEYDEDDDDSLNDRNETPFSFRVFSNPVEIHRFFEHQMNEMLKMFRGLEGPTHDGPMFGMPSLPFPFAPGGSGMVDEKPGTDKSLREYYLKPGYDVQPGRQTNQHRQDSDLDDRVKNGELGPMLESLPSSRELHPDKHHRSGWYHSMITFSTTRPDGSVEERRSVDNGSGKEETVTRRIGDKTYSITTTTDSNGLQTRTERLINLEKDNIDDFEKNWNGNSIPGLHTNPSMWFPFDKFF